MRDSIILLVGIVIGLLLVAAISVVFPSHPPPPATDTAQTIETIQRHLDYRATEIKSLELGIKERLEWLQSDELSSRSDASLMMQLSLDILMWDLERLAKYTNRDISEVANEYGIILPEDD